MEIHLLGSGMPMADAHRHGSSYVVELGDRYIMFDCGPATTHKLVRAGIRPTSVDHLFFTHHHFDHNVDYPCFLLTRWDEVTAERELQVFGPTLTEQLTHRLMDEATGAFAPDWIARINHPLSVNAYVKKGGVLPRKAPVTHATDIGPGSIVDGPDWRVTSTTAVHVQPWLDSLAYRLDTEEGSVVVTGDTAPCDSIIELARDADTMVSLCAFVQDDIEGTPEADAMCGSRDVAVMAQAAGVRRLVLTHQHPSLDRPGETERALRDISRHYDGEVVWGREMMRVPC
jgi:ribonuclease BN (tRNA processing enzyme)